jgi:phenylpropionate dioxygenase-like ring-hydroxylating dioxygenase large terminal subunit
MSNPPIPHKPIFNNFEIVAKGWYIACTSDQLAVGKALSVELCGQRLVLFRGQDGQARALAAACPHLGVDLGLGWVDGNWIRCIFHHWAFDEAGQCQQIPCQAKIPAQAKLPAYTTDEAYGFIWVYPAAGEVTRVAEFEELRGQPLVTSTDKPFERRCHHHICMMNGIDAQHLKTIHHLDIAMELSTHAHGSGSQIDFTMSGKFPQTTWRERLRRKILGPTYEYSMRYADGCVGLLTMMKRVRLMPPLHMIFAYTPIAPNRTRIQPIYVTAQRSGLWGWLVSQFLLWCTRWAYYMLRDEDGMVYDNIDFRPHLLLPIDAPLAQYMAYVNQLQPSQWSRAYPQSTSESVAKDLPPMAPLPAEDA